MIAEDAQTSASTPKRLPRPPAEHARSWLLVPGTKPEDFDAAANGSADAVILDIEDAVDPSHKEEAREDVASWLIGALIAVLGFVASLKRGVERMTENHLRRRKIKRQRAELLAAR